MTEKKSFLMYTSYLDNVEILSDEEAGQLLKAIYAFVNGDEVPKLDRVVQLTFNPIKSHLERDMEKYKDICRKRSENIQKRWEKRKNTNEYNCIQTDTNYTDNENVNENENVNVNENVNDNKNENVDDNKNDKPFPYLSLTRTEYEALCAKYGKERTDMYAERIQRYERVSSQKYNDVYEFMTNWLEERVLERH